jgi:hypothetical protein
VVKAQKTEKRSVSRDPPQALTNQKSVHYRHVQGSALPPAGPTGMKLTYISKPHAKGRRLKPRVFLTARTNHVLIIYQLVQIVQPAKLKPVYSCPPRPWLSPGSA